jgi:oligosaccharide repeat unit polymerase
MTGEDFLLKIIAILLSLMLLSQSLFFKKITKNFFHPAALFPLIWFLYTFLPLILLFTIPINPIGMVYILIFSLAFSSTALFFDWSKLKNKHPQKGNSYFIKLLIYCFSILSCVFTILHLRIQGIDVNFDITSTLQSAGQHALLSGQARIIGNIYFTLSLIFAYSSSALGGYIYRANTGSFKKSLLVFLSFAPAVLIVILMSGKLILFYSLTLFVAARLLVKIHKGEKFLTSRLNIKKSFVLLFLLIFVILFSINSRTYQAGGTGSILQNADYVFNTFINYTMAQIYAFSDFLSVYLEIKDGNVYDEDFVSNGHYTFNGILSQFGYGQEMPIGLYQESYNYNNRLSTNIFTGFRGIIVDFGMIIGVIIMSFFGLISNINHYFLLKNSAPYISSAVYCIIVAYIFSFYLVSFFVARWSFAVLIILFIVFFIDQYKFKWKNHK